MNHDQMLWNTQSNVAPLSEVAARVAELPRYRSSLCKRKLSGTGELGPADLYDKFRSIFAQIFGVARFPLHAYVKHIGFADAILANYQWKSLHDFSVIDDLHCARHRRLRVMLSPELRVELHLVTQRGPL